MSGAAASSASANDRSRQSQREDREAQLRKLHERRERARAQEQAENAGDSYLREVQIELEDGHRVPAGGKVRVARFYFHFGKRFAFAIVFYMDLCNRIAFCFPQAYLVKLSSQLGFNPQAWDPNTYDWAQDKKQGEDAADDQPPRTENIMRWRWTRNQFGNTVRLVFHVQRYW